MTRRLARARGILALACGVAVALVASGEPASAQIARALDGGLFWRAWMWGHQTQLNDWTGVGGRVGCFVLSELEIEGAASFARCSGTPGSHVDVVPISARIVWNYPLTSDLSLLLGAGYTHVRYRGAADARDDGAGILAGVRLGAGERLSIRIEGTADRLRRPFNSGSRSAVVDFGLQAGVDSRFGAVRPKLRP